MYPLEILTSLLQLTSFLGYYSCVFAPLLPELLLQFRARQTLPRQCFYTFPRGAPGKYEAGCPRCGSWTRGGPRQAGRLWGAGQQTAAGRVPERPPPRNDGATAPPTTGPLPRSRG